MLIILADALRSAMVKGNKVSSNRCRRRRRRGQQLHSFNEISTQLLVLLPMDSILRFLFDQSNSFEDIRYVVDAPLLNMKLFSGLVEIQQLVLLLVNELDELLGQEAQRAIEPTRPLLSRLSSVARLG